MGLPWLSVAGSEVSPWCSVWFFLILFSYLFSFSCKRDCVYLLLLENSKFCWVSFCLKVVSISIMQTYLQIRPGFVVFCSKEPKSDFQEHILDFFSTMKWNTTFFNFFQLTPKIPWDQKLVDCCLGGLWRKIIFFQFFLLDEWTTYFTSFPWTTSTSNSYSIWARGEFLLKTSIKLIFHVISKELLHAVMWLELPKHWRAGFPKNSLFCP
jgi:hypothetical protein